jgi:acyl transferase domain-containing protein
MPIMVVGMSFRRPKDATSVEIFERWSQSDGRDGVKFQRKNGTMEPFTILAVPGMAQRVHIRPDTWRWHWTNCFLKNNVEGGHFFEEDLANFDAPFFNMTNYETAASWISPDKRLISSINRAPALNPQLRLLLQGAFEALENGKHRGYTTQKLY